MDFTRLNEYPTIKQSRTYQNELAPRISLLRKFKYNFSVLGNCFKGIFSTNNRRNYYLLPELSVPTWKRKKAGTMNLLFANCFSKTGYRLEATGFYFKLDNALVQRRDSFGADYFVNAGNIKQKGLELHAELYLSCQQ